MHDLLQWVRCLSKYSLKGCQLFRCGVPTGFNGNRESFYFFNSDYTVPTLTGFITIGTSGITSRYQFQITMRLCHLLVIWGSTVKPMTRRFHFLQNLLGWKARRGLDSNTLNHFILLKGKPFPMESIWSPRAIQLLSERAGTLIQASWPSQAFFVLDANRSTSGQQCWLFPKENKTTETCSTLHARNLLLPCLKLLTFQKAEDLIFCSLSKDFLDLKTAVWDHVGKIRLTKLGISHQKVRQRCGAGCVLHAIGLPAISKTWEGLETLQKFVFREAVIFNGKTDKP